MSYFISEPVKSPTEPEMVECFKVRVTQMLISRVIY